MKPKLSLRIAAVFSFFIGTGNTIGYFTSKATTDPQGVEVVRQMEHHKFNFNGSLRSWDDIYNGLTLNTSIILFIFTAIFLILARSCKKSPELCYRLLWPALICFVGFTFTGVWYFFIVPAVSALIICIFLVLAMIKLNKRARNAPDEISPNNIAP